MTGQEIKEKIMKNNIIIEEFTNLAEFTLNKKVSDALNENAHLRNICPHEFNDLGFCIYCDKEYN